MNFNKSIKYLVFNTTAFFAIIGIGVLCGKYFYWGSTSHNLGLGNLFASILFALIIPLIVSFFIVRKTIVEVQYVFAIHILLTFAYILFYIF